jgi:hypothetical protein
MNPNSGNQRWSRWSFTIRPAGVRRPTFEDVKANAARFARKGFGTATQMRVATDSGGTVRIMVRTEGHPVHEAAYVTWVTAQWQRWAVNGWGAGTTLTCDEAKLEAGSRQDGTPSDQLIIAPQLALEDRLYDRIARSSVRWLRHLFRRAPDGCGA